MALRCQCRVCLTPRTLSLDIRARDEREAIVAPLHKIRLQLSQKFGVAGTEFIQNRRIGQPFTQHPHSLDDVVS